MIGGSHRLERLEELLDTVRFRKRRAEEAFDGCVKEIGIIVQNRVRRVRKNAKLAVGDVVVNLQRMLVANHIVIARQHKGWRSDCLKRCCLNVRLVEEQLRHL